MPSSASRVTSPAVIAGQARALGPLETPDVALRWRITGPFGLWCRSTGWIGSDLTVAIGREQVLVPLQGLTVHADEGYWLRTYEMPAVVPAFVEQHFHRGVGMWWELCLRPGVRVWLEEDRPAARGGYRSAEGPRVASRPMISLDPLGSAGDRRDQA